MSRSASAAAIPDSSKRKGRQNLGLLLILCSFFLSLQFVKLDNYLEAPSPFAAIAVTNNPTALTIEASGNSGSGSTANAALQLTNDDTSPRVLLIPAAGNSNSTNHTANHTATIPVSLSLQKGSWSGNTWHPPIGWRYYLPWQLPAIYNSSSVLWVGDSTVRRASLTWHELLMSSSSLPLDDPAGVRTWSASRMDRYKLLDVSKYDHNVECRRFSEVAHVNRPRICRPMSKTNTTTTAATSTTKEYWYIRQKCTAEMEHFFWNEIRGKSNFTAAMDLIVVGVSGVWDLDVPDYCNVRNKRRDFQTVVSDLWKVLAEFQRVTQKWVAVRTSGFSDWGEERADNTRALNRQLREEFTNLQQNATKGEPQILLADWGAAVEERSLGEDRIRGDGNKAHYGFEARWVWIQILTNLLIEYGYTPSRN